MKDLELIYDHYKDTFSMIKENEKKRDKLFILLFVLLLLLFLCSIMPSDIYSMFQDIIKNKLETNIMFGFDIIQTFLWIIIFYTTVKYFQIVVHINRSYEYLNNIEKQINKKIKFKFQREGNQYFDNYPLLLDYIYQMYITVFPILYGLLITFQILFEWIKNSNLYLNIIDAIIYIFILILIILYYIILHTKKN
ncbi:MAG: hypothetical protein N2749_06670 [Clostridia bacterium]|nr:hypothetical protein [Clostridia bacterium]